MKVSWNWKQGVYLKVLTNIRLYTNVTFKKIIKVISKDLSGAVEWEKMREDKPGGASFAGVWAAPSLTSCCLEPHHLGPQQRQPRQSGGGTVPGRFLGWQGPSGRWLWAVGWSLTGEDKPGGKQGLKDKQGGRSHREWGGKRPEPPRKTTCWDWQIDGASRS